MAKNTNNYGSRKPLNWTKKELSNGPVKKAVSHTELIEKAHRQGTPITTRGSFNGYVSKLGPNPNIAEIRPALFLDVNKAAPASSSGELQEQQSLPQQAADTREEQQEGQERRQDYLVGRRGGKIIGHSQTGRPIYAKNKSLKDGVVDRALDKAFMNKALGVPQVPLRPEQQQGQMQQGTPLAQPKIPGFNQMTQPVMAMQQQGQPMGQTPQGQPTFNDPFHPAHQQFGKEEHDAASSQQQAQGNQMAANAHSQMGKDAQSPMERAGDRFGQAGGQPPQKAPEMKGTQQPYGIHPDQGKPQAPPQIGPDRNGPKPGMHEVVPTGQPIGQPAGHMAPPGQQMHQQPNSPPPGHMGTPGQPGQTSTQDLLRLIESLKQLVMHESGEQQQGQMQPPMPHMPPAPMMQSAPQYPGQDKQAGPSTGPMSSGSSPPMGASSHQEPLGAPRPQKQTGSSAPPTNAGDQKTPIEPTARKSIFKSLGW